MYQTIARNLVHDGMVTECSSSNAWIVDQKSRVITRPLGLDILPGLTRDRVIKLARENGIEVMERAFSVEEAKNAREAFLTQHDLLRQTGHADRRHGDRQRPSRHNDPHAAVGLSRFRPESRVGRSHLKYAWFPMNWGNRRS